MSVTRRSFLKGMAGILAAGVAPSIITTPGLLMPVRKIIVPDYLTATEVLARQKEYFEHFARMHAEEVERVMIYGNPYGELAPSAFTRLFLASMPPARQWFTLKDQSCK